MIFFKEYFLLREAKFSQSKKVVPLLQMPMFSVYLFKDDADKVEDVNELKEEMRVACIEARKIITKMGFPSMHSNILIKDLSKEENWVSGGGVGGYAHHKGKYMTVSSILLDHLDELIKTIVHEWAHLWMINNSEGFKNAVKGYYNTLLSQYKTHFSTSQQQRDKASFKNINKYQHFDKIEEILGRNYSDNIYTEIVQHMMRNVKNTYYDYIYNCRYAEEDSPWKEDEKTFINNTRKSLIKDTESMILRIMDDIQEVGYYPRSGILSKQINYMSNAMWKIFYMRVMKGIIFSVKDDEQDFKWAKEDGEEWASRFESLLQYLEGPTNNNENFIFDKTTSYIDLYTKYHEFTYKFDPPSMIINLIYGIIENTINQKEFPQAENKLVGKDKGGYREEMKNLVKWVNSYGMANDDELWATGVEGFLELPPNHRKAILKLMKTRGERTKPNRRKTKHIRKAQKKDFDNSILADLRL